MRADFPNYPVFQITPRYPIVVITTKNRRPVPYDRGAQPNEPSSCHTINYRPPHFYDSTAENGAYLHKQGDFSLPRPKGLCRRSKLTRRAVYSSGKLGVYANADDAIPREAASRVEARA